MAGAVQANPVQANSRILSTAQTYKGIVDGVLYTAMGATECTLACASAACTVWQRGLSGNLKEMAKYCYGINDFKAAKDELGRSVEKKGEEEVRVPLSERIGKASAMVTNGIGKIAVTNTATAVGLTYVSGMACKALDIAGDTGSLVEAAKMTATGLNTVASIAYGAAGLAATPVSMVAKAGLSAIATGVSVAVSHPKGVLATTGVGLGLYGASYATIKASEATGVVSKTIYQSAALASTAFALGSLLTGIVG